MGYIDLKELFRDLSAPLVDRLCSLENWRKKHMATIQDLQDKIAAEGAQVAEGFASLKTEIQALKDQLANGVVVSNEQLDSLLAAVDGIFTPEVAAEPAPVEPTPEVPVEDVPADPAPVEDAPAEPAA